jgi:hypothetical protein
MLVGSPLLILAILVTGFVAFRMIAREGGFGWQMQNYVFESRHPKAFVIAAVLLWTAWACAEDM